MVAACFAFRPDNNLNPRPWRQRPSLRRCLRSPHRLLRRTACRNQLLKNRLNLLRLKSTARIFQKYFADSGVRASAIVQEMTTALCWFRQKGSVIMRLQRKLGGS